MNGRCERGGITKTNTCSRWQITEQETNAGEIQAETEEADDDLSTNEQSLSMNESVVQEIAVENEKQAEADEDVESLGIDRGSESQLLGEHY